MGNSEVIPLVSASMKSWPTLGIRKLPMFQVCGYTGFALGFVQSMLLVKYLGLSVWIQLGIAGVVILTFYVLMMVTKILAGKEVIIYYHHEIAVIATTSLFLKIVHQPVLPYLDVTVLGIGLFLACGRIGCLMVGCCHGRPWRWGVAYGHDHSQAGFPSYLVGVRLFPVQAIESIFALMLVSSGIAAIIRGYPPGSALGLYVVCYAIGRFCFEFFRGDTARPYYLGFSEAQWISLFSCIVECAAEYAGLLPHYRWHTAAPVALTGIMLTSRFWRDKRQTLAWIEPKHIREIAEALQISSGDMLPAEPRRIPSLSLDSNTIHVAETSLGLRISSAELGRGTKTLRCYALSCTNGTLPLDSALLAGRMISRLRHASLPFELVKGRTGVFHLIFREHSDRTENLPLRKEWRAP
jgi:hypothetical protein